MGTKAGPAEVPSFGSNCVGSPRRFIAANRLTDYIRYGAVPERSGRRTRLRVEVLGIADLDRAGGAMNSGIVVNRVLFRDLFRIHRGVCFTLFLM